MITKLDIVKSYSHKKHHPLEDYLAKEILEKIILGNDVLSILHNNMFSLVIYTVMKVGSIDFLELLKVSTNR